MSILWGGRPGRRDDGDDPGGVVALLGAVLAAVVSVAAMLAGAGWAAVSFVDWMVNQ